MSDTYAKKTVELLDTVLERLANGETLTAISRDLNFSRTIWARWMDADPELAKAYYHARSIGSDAIADDIVEIVDKAPADAVGVAKARLRADTRLKLLAKWQPDKYGEKVDVRHQGHDGGAVQVAHIDVVALARQVRNQRSVGEALPPPTGEDLL